MARPPTHISELLDEVTKAITVLVENEEQFTILDVSEEVKKELAVSHQDVRIIAKPILDNIVLRIPGNVYITSQIEVDTPTGKARACLYHPDWTSASVYTNRSKVASKPVVVSPAQPSTPVQPAASKQSCNQTAPSCVQNADWSTIVNPRSDGKVAIPAEAFRQAGITGRVKLSVHPNSISLYDGNDLSTRELRVSTRDLTDANILNKPVYICAFRGKIVVCS